jgi:hypothetical protein
VRKGKGRVSEEGKEGKEEWRGGESERVRRKEIEW